MHDTMDEAVYSKFERRPLKMGLIGWLKISIPNYQSALCNILKKWRPHILGG